MKKLSILVVLLPILILAGCQSGSGGEGGGGYMSQIRRGYDTGPTSIQVLLADWHPT